jgi:hypothetical protein
MAGAGRESGGRGVEGEWEKKYPTAISGRESTPINNKIACRRILLTVSHSIPSNYSWQVYSVEGADAVIQSVQQADS